MTNGNSLALLTDLYQLTMAYGYWKLGRAERTSVFHLYFRNKPFSGGYALACGTEAAIEFIEAFRFDPSDLTYLATLNGNDGQPLFEPRFLDYLGALRLTCDVDLVPEGTVVFSNEPLVRVRGPIIQGQLLETALLNMVNFATLVATKAARVCEAARGDPVAEFGLRRAQGMDGGITASRAAYIGGCSSTSNLLAGKRFGIPVSGTHAHSWVMSFDSEIEAFEGYAAAMPNNCVFLVDTYDTLQGVRNAAAVGRKLKAMGKKMVGIRLDSGDLAYLSIQARKILDDAGLQDARIVASNDLDERLIDSLKAQGAQIAVWGVGTKMVTAYDQPALGGVYKLGAIADEHGTLHPVMKHSDQIAKASFPGILNVRRFSRAGRFVADMMYDELLGVHSLAIVDPRDITRVTPIDPSLESHELLLPAIRTGRRVLPPVDATAARERARAELAALHPTIRRRENPHEYPVGLEPGLSDARTRMIRDRRESRLGRSGHS